MIGLANQTRLNVKGCIFSRNTKDIRWT